MCFIACLLSTWHVTTKLGLLIRSLTDKIYLHNYLPKERRTHSCLPAHSPSAQTLGMQQQTTQTKTSVLMESREED